MTNENDIKSFLSTENTCYNLIKNQESESIYVHDTSSSSDEDINENQQIRYVVFPKWTWKLVVISIIAIIVLILLTFFIIKHYFKKND